MESGMEHDENGRRFDVIVDGRSGGYLTYEICDGALDIQHTVVNVELRGRGLGEVLVTAAAKFAESKGLKIVPTCSYAKKLLGNKKM